MVDKYHIVLGIDCRHHAQLSKGSIMNYMFCFYFKTDNGYQGYGNATISGLNKPFGDSTLTNVTERCLEIAKKNCPMAQEIEIVIMSCINLTA